MPFGGLKVLMISSDRNIFVPGSAVSERMKEYGNLVEELHIVVLTDSSLKITSRFPRDGELVESKNGKPASPAGGLKISDNVFAYPTKSAFKILRPLNAASLGKKIVLKNKFVRGLSLITTQDPFECGWAGLRIKKKWRIPLEVQIHTNLNSPYFTGFLNNIRKIIAKRVLARADSIRDVKSLPIYVEKEKIENSPINFDIHTHYPWHFIILMVCRLEKEKNLPLALKILSLVRQKFPDTGLLIVGSGREEASLKVMVKKMNLSGSVEFAGWKDDLASYYKTANAFLQTSTFEGYGMALVEAGLSGLPVITTPVGIATELEHGKDAYIYPTGRPELFAEGIIDLIENNQKRENLKANLKKTLESKLLSKEEYMAKIKDNWEHTSKVLINK
jgi:glycosyltransferase involved in cell wall biosynthesis